MQDRPTAHELLDAVREFLAGGERSGRRAEFLVRVAANVLGIVEREIRLGHTADALERERLHALLGSDEADLRVLNAGLAARIRSGELGREDVIEHLRATVADKLAIANPRHLDA